MSSFKVTMRNFLQFCAIANFYISSGYSYDILNGTYAEGNHDNNDALVEFVPLSYHNHPCKRPCIKGGKPMACQYHFLVEWYQTLSKACYSCPQKLEDCFRHDCIIGDGRRRTVLVINRMLPGPSIDVCYGDTIIVNVENLLMAETTSMHWHGLHQINSPYMDGVPFVTQCPISPGSVFTYKFIASNAGTHFWHSHTAMQRGDGAFGPLIIHKYEDQDPHKHLYDFDLTSHIITMLDWDVDLNLNMFISHYHGLGDNKPSTLLINGLGLRNFENLTENAPIARFHVEKGYRYRFRVINAGFLNCPIEMSVDYHTMKVINSDGNDFKPVDVTSLVLYAGERFDFILNANQTQGTYWMKFKGLMDCDERFTKARQVAILQYDNGSHTSFPTEPVPDYHRSHNEGIQMNPLNKGTEDNLTTISLPQLKSTDPWDSSLQEEADYKFFISYDFYKIDNPHYHKFPHYGFYNITNPKQQVLTPQLNHISLKLPPFPLLSGRDNIDRRTFCNESTLRSRNCTKEFCQCTHVLEVKLNSIVEVILVDTGFAYDANHPFHLHGHSFRVVGMERLNKSITIEKVKDLDRRGLLKRNLIDPPIKDTVTIPDGGYTIIRFNASNPGYWLFHCHIEFHVEVGMALIFKFGDHEQMPPVPSNFPKCGSFRSKEMTSVTSAMSHPPTSGTMKHSIFATYQALILSIVVFIHIY